MQIFESCSFWIAKLILVKSGIVTLSSVILFFSVHDSVTGQTPLLRLLGDTAELTCASSTDNDIFIWSDQSVTPALNIYIVNNANVQEKTGSAMTKPKYDNFGLVNNYPDFANLIIQSVEIEDEGPYQCTLSNVADDSVAYDVHVEALPMSVSMSCNRSPPSTCPASGAASSEFTCSCHVVGVYPETVTMKWINAEEVSDTSVTVNSTDRLGAFDLIGNATFTPSEMSTNTATCTVEGYSGSWMSVPEAKYVTAPPICEMTPLCNGTNTGVTLTCSCRNAYPSDGLIYSFFEDDELIQSGATYSIDVSIEPNVKVTFGCRQCNGVYYGEQSYASVSVTCTDATVTTPSISTKEDGTPTGTKGPPVGLIVGLSVGIPFLIIILVLVIWFLKNRDGDSNKKPEPPQPTAAPRTSQNVPDDQPMQELQYADLDHGKQPPTNEIRKPQDEPTEYATVQSVIV